MSADGLLGYDPDADQPRVLIAAAIRSARMAADLIVEIGASLEPTKNKSSETPSRTLPEGVNRRDLAARAERLYQQRRRRDTIFDTALFGEPAFDILLDLYIARVRCTESTISSCCYAAAVPHTTRLRWVALLEQRGLLLRSKDLFDGRRVLVELSDEAMTLMDTFLVGVA